jgi:hypothetical protein
MTKIELYVNTGSTEHHSLVAFLMDNLYEFSSTPVLPQTYVSRRFLPPFRVGRKTKRAVLDSKGLEVVVFPKGLEGWAELYCQALNKEMAV